MVRDGGGEFVDIDLVGIAVIFVSTERMLHHPRRGYFRHAMVFEGRSPSRAVGTHHHIVTVSGTKSFDIGYHLGDSFRVCGICLAVVSLQFGEGYILLVDLINAFQHGVALGCHPVEHKVHSVVVDVPDPVEHLDAIGLEVVVEIVGCDCIDEQRTRAFLRGGRFRIALLAGRHENRGGSHQRRRQNWKSIFHSYVSKSQ